jgi:hypothetical protein
LSARLILSHTMRRGQDFRLNRPMRRGIAGLFLLQGRASPLPLVNQGNRGPPVSLSVLLGLARLSCVRTLDAAWFSGCRRLSRRVRPEVDAATRTELGLLPGHASRDATSGISALHSRKALSEQAACSSTV